MFETSINKYHSSLFKRNSHGLHVNDYILRLYFIIYCAVGGTSQLCTVFHGHLKSESKTVYRQNDYILQIFFSVKTGFGKEHHCCRFYYDENSREKYFWNKDATVILLFQFDYYSYLRYDPECMTNYELLP